MGSESRHKINTGTYLVYVCKLKEELLNTYCHNSNIRSKVNWIHCRSGSCFSWEPTKLFYADPIRRRQFSFSRRIERGNCRSFTLNFSALGTPQRIFSTFLHSYSEEEESKNPDICQRVRRHYPLAMSAIKGFLFRNIPSMPGLTNRMYENLRLILLKTLEEEFSTARSDESVETYYPGCTWTDLLTWYMKQVLWLDNELI